MATVAQIGATLAGVVFGVLLAHSDRFQVIWLSCAILSLIRLVLLIPFFLHRRERLSENVSAPVG